MRTQPCKLSPTIKIVSDEDESEHVIVLCTNCIVHQCALTKCANVLLRALLYGTSYDFIAIMLGALRIRM